MRILLFGNVSLATLALCTNCAYDTVGGKPDLPRSNKNGVSTTFHRTEPQITVAISNAFRDFSFHGMGLFSVAEVPELLRDWQPASGYLLFPYNLDGITNVPLVKGGATNWLPYTAYFYIEIRTQASDVIRLAVHTIEPRVMDGKQFGIHFGEAVHYRKVPAIRREEENALAEISKALNENK